MLISLALPIAKTWEDKMHKSRTIFQMNPERDDKSSFSK